MTATNAALVEAKLRALARACSGLDLDAVDPTVGTAQADDRAFFLATDDPRAVGRAMHWAASSRASEVDILAEGHGSDLARRATHLNPAAPRVEPGRWPTVRVWRVDGATTEPAVAGPVASPPEIPANHRALAAVMSEAGARPVDDHGRLVAEFAGLEVGRVVDSDEGPTIDVGVGQADRELNQLVHGEADPGAALRRVIAAVAEYRSSRSHHPLTRVARERWLRSRLLDRPDSIGAAELDPAPPLRPREGLLATEAAAAVGHLRSGRPVVVVTMVGVDLDLALEAADYRQRHDPEAQLVVMVPRRDIGVGTALVELLDDATVTTAEAPWLAG